MNPNNYHRDEAKPFLSPNDDDNDNDNESLTPPPPPPRLTSSSSSQRLYRRASLTSTTTASLRPMKHMETVERRNYAVTALGFIFLFVIGILMVWIVTTSYQAKMAKKWALEYDDDYMIQNDYTAENNDNDDYYHIDDKHPYSIYADSDNKKKIINGIKLADDSLKKLNDQYHHLLIQKSKTTTTTKIAPIGCECKIIMIRHCEGGDDHDDDNDEQEKDDIVDKSHDSKSQSTKHCSKIGRERSHYISTLFVNDTNDDNSGMPSSSSSSFVSSSVVSERQQHPVLPVPYQLYALSTNRTDHEDVREYETLVPLSDRTNIPITFIDSDQLIKKLHHELNDGILCGRTIIISWKHNEIALLGQNLGCNVQNGCPYQYHYDVYDQIWQLKLVLLSSSKQQQQQERIDELEENWIHKYHHNVTYKFDNNAKKKDNDDSGNWNVFGSVLYQNFIPSSSSDP